jgi:hypothetical protein
MSLASIYMDADISGASIHWEETAACPLLKLVTELQHIESELILNETTTLRSCRDFVQMKLNECVEGAGKPGGLKAKWLPEILAKCHEVAMKECSQIVSDKHLDAATLNGLSELAEAAYKTLETTKLHSLRVHFSIARAFTLKAVEQFATRAQELRPGQQAAGFSYFDSFKEFAPLVCVASSIYEFVADKDITSLDALERYVAQIRQQFSATEELSKAAREESHQMLELCLSNSLIAGRLALERHLEAA